MRMNIVTSLNDAYLKYTSVLLTSVLVNQKPENEIHIYIMHCDLHEETITALTKLCEQYGAIPSFLQIDKSIYEKFPTSEDWSAESYIRLSLLDVLPKDVDRILYFDGDVIVNGPLDEMYCTDMGENEIGGCTDICCIGGIGFNDSRREIFAKQIEEGTLKYICSGVTLWDISKMRGRYSFEKYFSLAESLDFKMTAPDQDILNLAHHGKIYVFEDYMKYEAFGRLSYSRGLRYEEAKANTLVLHYIGAKPWRGNCIHFDLERIWWDYAKMTPYYAELLEAHMEETMASPQLYESFKTLIDSEKKLGADLNEALKLCRTLYAQLYPEQ